ncbi:right-handed parallel beta-helix repeat-containing protein [Microbulbifer sp. CNSA002]|uniref:right-handed parallel beta-helix repeat-containing protein n=1 Tax=Microbulbifer sp. CNSA002 TaxID=3373604 RepID=UPI0039B3DE7C
MKLPRSSLYKIAIVSMIGISNISISKPVIADDVECGDTITTSVTLDEDLTCDVSPALTVIGPDGRLNMTGYEVQCDGSEVGVLLEGRAALLRGGQVADCEVGVLANGDGFHNIQAVSATANASAGFQLVSNSNYMTACTAQENTGVGLIVSGERNNVFQNTFEENTLSGIQIDGDRSYITENFCFENMGSGIEINDSSNSWIVENASENNGTSGAGAAGILMNGFDQQYNLIILNVGILNEDFDAQDLNSDPCNGTNLWRNNTFDTVDPSCLD